MVQSLKVILWGEAIGRLAWDARRRLSYFMYNPAFLKKGLNISPLAAPVDGARGLMPVWGEEAKIYQKLPAFLADSLPDSWVINFFFFFSSRITCQTQILLLLTNSHL